MLRMLAVLAIAAVSLVAAQRAAGGAGGGHLAAAPKQLHLTFTKVLDDMTGSYCLRASGDYLLVPHASRVPYPCGPRLWLVNGVTGKRTTISPPPHTSLAGFAMPRLLLGTSRGYRLFNVRTRNSRPVPCGLGCGDPRNISVDRWLGTLWAEFTIQQSGDCGDGAHLGCGPAYANFSSISSDRSVDHIFEPGTAYGGIHGEPGQAVAANTVVDLDSTSHYRKICSPLTVSTGDRVKFFGRFVLIEYAVNPPPGVSDLALRRCGTTLTVPLTLSPSTLATSDVIGSNRVVLWKRPGSAPYIDGLMLPDLTRFTARIPSAAVSQYGGTVVMAVAGRRLYLISKARLLAAQLL